MINEAFIEEYQDILEKDAGAGILKRFIGRYPGDLPGRVTSALKRRGLANPNAMDRGGGLRGMWGRLRWG